MCARSIAGVLSSQALPGFLITSDYTPPVRVPVVIVLVFRGIRRGGTVTLFCDAILWLRMCLCWVSVSPTLECESTRQLGEC